MPPPAAALCLAALHGRPGLAVAVAPGCWLRVTSTLYDICDSLRGVALFGAPGSALERLVLILAPDVGVHAPRPRATCEPPLGGVASGPGGSRLRKARVGVVHAVAFGPGARICRRPARALHWVPARLGEAVAMFNGIEYGFLGVVVVDDDDEFARPSEVRDVEECHVMCLAGQKGRKEGIGHAGCGH
ncbi:hypothetical protein EDB87DRAFT_1578217 [Lactarius vividus]|nr:hypothetical protein EDB87DRAFT_1578217 [Lactarius vividus]